MTAPAPQYLFDPKDKPTLPVVQVPLIEADDAAMTGYGYLVDGPERCEIEIVPWPAQGWRPIDAGTGDEGGTTEGIFHCHWSDGVLMARNEAVDGEYVLGRCIPRIGRAALSGSAGKGARQGQLRLRQRVRSVPVGSLDSLKIMSVRADGRPTKS